MTRAGSDFGAQVAAAVAKVRPSPKEAKGAALIVKAGRFDHLSAAPSPEEAFAGRVAQAVAKVRR